jgi:hypothetical protein
MDKYLSLDIDQYRDRDIDQDLDIDRDRDIDQYCLYFNFFFVSIIVDHLSTTALEY